MIDVDDVTREPSSRLVTDRGHLPVGKTGQNSRKKLSHRRTKFPSTRSWLGGAIEQRAGEFQAQQVVSIGVVHPHGPSPQGARSPWKSRGRCQWGAWNFQHNLGRFRQGAPHGHQCSPCAHIQGRGKLEEFFAFFVPASYKNRNRQWQSSPLAAFFLGPESQTLLPDPGDLHLSSSHLMGQISVQHLEPLVRTPRGLEYSRETSLPAPDSAFSWDFLGVSAEILDRCFYPVEKCNDLP
jgi:hypothetical protein